MCVCESECVEKGEEEEEEEEEEEACALPYSTHIGSGRERRRRNPLGT